MGDRKSTFWALTTLYGSFLKSGPQYRPKTVVLLLQGHSQTEPRLLETPIYDIALVFRHRLKGRDALQRGCRKLTWQHPCTHGTFWHNLNIDRCSHKELVQTDFILLLGFSCEMCTLCVTTRVSYPSGPPRDNRMVHICLSLP